MIQSVIKKDGGKVPFNQEKLKASITAAADDAGLQENEKNAIAEKVLYSVEAAFEGREEVSTAEIRDKVLSELHASFPIVAEAWIKYDSARGK